MTTYKLQAQYDHDGEWFDSVFTSEVTGKPLAEAWDVADNYTDGSTLYTYRVVEVRDYVEAPRPAAKWEDGKVYRYKGSTQRGSYAVTAVDKDGYAVAVYTREFGAVDDARYLMRPDDRKHYEVV